MGEQRFGECAVGAATLDGPAGEDNHPGGGGAFGNLVEQSRLADPSFAGDQQGSA